MLAGVNGKSKSKSVSLQASRVWYRWALALVLALMPIIVGSLAIGQEPVVAENEKDNGAPEETVDAESEKQDAEQEVEEESSLDPGTRLGLVLKSKAEGAKVYTAIPGAKKTVLAAARKSEYGMRAFSDVEWRDKAYDLREFYAEAERTADAVVDAMEPEFLRDSRGVIEYALVKSEDAFLSTALTSKRFLPRFEREFGEELRVVVVDRQILYVFPAIGGKLEAYGPAIAEIYRTTRFPVSLEVFQVNAKGYRVVGTLDSE
jgi:hypothetical protein